MAVLGLVLIIVVGFCRGWLSVQWEGLWWFKGFLGIGGALWGSFRWYGRRGKGEEWGIRGGIWELLIALGGGIWGWCFTGGRLCLCFCSRSVVFGFVLKGLLCFANKGGLKLGFFRLALVLIKITFEAMILIVEWILFIIIIRVGKVVLLGLVLIRFQFVLLRYFLLLGFVLVLLLLPFFSRFHYFRDFVLDFHLF